MPRPNPSRRILGERGLARRIAWERERRQWSTEGLAKRMTDAGCPINQSAIWKIENGDPPRRITYDEALAFAEVFEIPLDDLAVPPELAANEALRALVEEHQRAEVERMRLGIKSGALVEQIRSLVAQFPNADAVLREMFPDDEELGERSPASVADFYAGRGWYGQHQETS